MEEEFYTIEESIEDENCFDRDYEFDAPRCFDFTRPETDWDAKEAELWFESAGSNPPSPFITKFKWRYDVNADGEFDNASTVCDEHNGEPCNSSYEGNTTANTNSSVKSSLLRSSTLMKPTASYLAKQNKFRIVISDQSQRRLQKSIGSIDKSYSFNEGDETKRQKLEAGYLWKVAHLKHQSQFLHKESKMFQSLDGGPRHVKPKVTIPIEPNLQTAKRIHRHRSNDKAELEEYAKQAHLFKARPLNKKILKAPSLPLPKKSLPQPPEFKLFNLRTSERAKKHASNNAMKVPIYVSTSRSDHTHTRLRSFKSMDSSKGDKQEAVNKSKACVKKVMSSKGENGVLQNMNQTTTTMRLPDEPPTELFNKLSLSSEVHSGEKAQEKTAISDGLKENEPGTFLLQCQIMKASKGTSQRNGRMQYQCRRHMNTEIGGRQNFSRRLRLDVI